MKFLTYERFIHTSILEEGTVRAYKSVHQGGVISPLCYLIYNMKVDEKVNRKVTTLQFADDIAVVVKEDSAYDLIRETELAINTISSNLEKIGLELSPKKRSWYILTKEISCQVKT